MDHVEPSPEGSTELSLRPPYHNPFHQAFALDQAVGAPPYDPILSHKLVDAASTEVTTVMRHLAPMPVPFGENRKQPFACLLNHDTYNVSTPKVMLEVLNSHEYFSVLLLLHLPFGAFPTP